MFYTYVGWRLAYHPATSLQEFSMSGYSSDMIKKAAFLDELNNVLIQIPVEDKDEDILTVEEYVRRRIKEIEKLYS